MVLVLLMALVLALVQTFQEYCTSTSTSTTRRRSVRVRVSVRAVVVFLRVSATCEWQRVNVGFAMRWRCRLASKAAFSEIPLCFYWRWCRYDAVVAICDLCFFCFPGVLGGGGLPRILVQMVSSARVRMASNGPISRAKGRVVVR